MPDEEEERQYTIEEAREVLVKASLFVKAAKMLGLDVTPVEDLIRMAKQRELDLNDLKHSTYGGWLRNGNL